MCDMRGVRGLPQPLSGAMANGMGCGTMLIFNDDTIYIFNQWYLSITIISASLVTTALFSSNLSALAR